MSKELGFPRFRYTIRGLMIIVAVAAFALMWVAWTQRPRPSPVSGTISSNGRPVASGKIVFLPRNPAGQQAISQIINGKYSLTSFAPNDGALPGTYDIVVVSPSVAAKYQLQSTSGLISQIQQGANMLDFVLR
jgi:hypothetical protein